MSIAYGTLGNIAFAALCSAADVDGFHAFNAFGERQSKMSASSATGNAAADGASMGDDPNGVRLLLHAAIYAARHGYVAIMPRLPAAGTCAAAPAA